MHTSLEKEFAMMRNALPAAAGALLAVWMVGCSSSSSSSTAPVSSPLQVTILQTTDLHDHAMGVGHVGAGALAPSGSYARIAAYVNYVRANAGHPVVLVDSGDWSMGTLYDLTLGQQPLALYYMSAMGYDCATLGNHEFDYTPAGLAQILHAASTFQFWTPVVASNANLNGNTDLAPYIGAGKTVQSTSVETLKNGLKIGYIGLIGKNAASDAPASAPVTFTDYSADYTFVQKLVDGLRNTQKCDIVVALSHAGTDPSGLTGEDVDLATHVTGINVIASGHTHNAFSSAHAVANGDWNTQIICAGAYGSNVSRIDLTFHSDTHSTTVDASSNPAMTDAGLVAQQAGLVADPIFASIVNAADLQLNVGLGPLFTQVFSDYDAAKLDKGIYHPVGAAVQDMVPNDVNPVPSPNGMGNLCADADRAVPNGIITQVLLANGWNGSPTDPNLPAIIAALEAAGYDPTPFTASIVATGVVRGSLSSGVALSFADVYNVFPLGISPDTSQSIPVGYPLVSAYLELADLKTVCALQLLAQSGLVTSDLYLNLSGISYTLKDAESYAYFKAATAAGVLKLTSAKATGGSTTAQAAMAALASLSTDSGAALLAAAQGGNVYALYMVDLNDYDPQDPAKALSPAQYGANLTALGEVAVLGTSFVVGQAVAAIDTVSAFGPTDVSCTGSAGALTAGRHRVAADLYAILMMGAVQAEFGVSLTPYKAATGSEVLSAADMAGLLGNRINASPGGSSVQELKEWMALLNFVGDSSGLGGQIGAGYASTADFTKFSACGNAVTIRNASYPLAGIGLFATMLADLEAAS